ncbi:hypothetical protein [Phormidesmis sp. 146-33]
MLETIPLLLATPIAKIILDKLYEGVGSKLGEKVVEAATAPIQKLGQVVWDRCFKGKPGTDKLLEAAAKGSEPELKQVQNYLLKEMENPAFVEMVRPIAQEIHQVLVRFEDVNAKNVQQIFGGQGLQVNERQDQPIIQIQGNPTLHFGTQSKSDNPKTTLMSHDRLRHLENQLEILQEQQAELEQEALLRGGLPKVQIEQELRLKIKPKIREYEQEYWQILAKSAPEVIADPDAEVIVAEIVESVGRLEAQQDSPTEIMQILLGLRDKLNRPETSAAIKVKWALSAIPPFVSLATEGELDLEKFLQTNFPTFRRWSKELAKKL